MGAIKLHLLGSNGEPADLQVRRPRFSRVVACTHSRPRDLAIEPWLPSDHQTYVIAEARDDFYGVGLRVRDDEQVDIAVTLLREALERAE